MRPLLHQLSGKGRIDADLIGDLERGDVPKQPKTLHSAPVFFSFSWQKRNMLDHYNAMVCEQVAKGFLPRSNQKLSSLHWIAIDLLKRNLNKYLHGS